MKKRLKKNGRPLSKPTVETGEKGHEVHREINMRKTPTVKRLKTRQSSKQMCI